MDKPSWAIRLFYAMLTDPKFSFEYFNRDQRSSIKKGAERWKIMMPQLDYMLGLLWFNEIVIASGRSVGKSSSVEHMLFMLSLTHPRKWSAYIVRNARHANVLIQHLIDYFNKDSFTRELFVNYDKKDRIFTLRNGHKIEIRIAGHDKTGATTMVSGHYDFIFVDEAQLLPKKILEELLPALKEGGKIVVTGVPNDVRDSILYYFVTRKEAMYYRYASYESADWDEDKEKRALELYGGKHTQQWRNLVEGCLPPDQLILTKRGLIPIIDVKINDEVITHKNRWRKVTKTFELDYTGPIHHIKTSYDDNELIITPEHPISSKLCEWKTVRNPDKKSVKITTDIDFRLPGELKKGDKIQFPQLNYNNNNLTDKDFAYTLGLYFAEGSSDKYHIRFSLHKKETYLIDKINKYFNNSPSIYYSKYDKGMNVTYGSIEKSAIINNYIFGNATDKTFNDDIFNSSNEFKIEFLRGIFDGDGCRRARHYNDKISIEYALGLATINGIYQIRLLLRQLGINSSVTHLPAKQSEIYDNRLNKYRKMKSNGVFRLDIYGWYASELDKIFGYTCTNEYNNKKHFVSDFIDYSTIIYNKINLYSGKVYNIEVEEDNSYTVSDKVVHNCWGDSASAAFRPSKLVEGQIKNHHFRYKKYNGNSFDDLFSQLNLPILVPKYDFYIIGGDMGYTANSPSHIIVLGVYDRKNPEGESVQHYDVLYRLEIENMASFNMAKTINYLIEYFNCKHIAIDTQTLGHQIYDHLIDREIFPITYRQNKMYMYPVIFTRPVIVGHIQTVDQVTGKPADEEIIYSEKVASTNKLIQLVEDERLHIAHEDSGAEDFDDLVTVMMAETQTTCTRRHSPFTYTNSVNDHCFIKGTKVTTNDGYKKIEDIKIGDNVLTRKGYKKVLDSWMTQKNAEVQTYIINGKEITCTPNHKFYINNEWKEINELKIGDKIIILKEKNKWITKLNQLYLMVSSLGNQKMKGIINHIVKMAKLIGSTYIEKFGNFIKEKFLKGIIYITRMKTEKIMKLKTSNVNKKQNIYHFIQRNILKIKNIMTKSRNILITSELKLLNGTAARKENLLIVKILNRCGKLLRILIKHVNFVIKNIVYLKTWIINLNFVQTFVGVVIEVPRNITKILEYVKYVVKSMSLIKHQNQKHVQEVVVESLKIIQQPSQDVYDITVEEEHEFFANDILVHNCVDALRCCAMIILQIIEKGYSRKNARTSVVPSRLGKGLFKRAKKPARRERFFG
jgi:intein/homing endonuclease